MTFLNTAAVEAAQDFLREKGIDGWLLYDCRQLNPVFSEVVGHSPFLTRPCFFFIPAQGRPVFLVHRVDVATLQDAGGWLNVYSSRSGMLELLSRMLQGSRIVAMEYSPEAALPRLSRVDGGTLELIRGVGVEVVPSADLVQYATARWGERGFASHCSAAAKLGKIVMEAFGLIGRGLGGRLTEYEVYEFIRRRFQEEGLVSEEGPIVAVNQHSALPHYEPPPSGGVAIRAGDWVLIDLWGREKGGESIYADITWVGYVGEKVPERYAHIFRTVVQARDLALDYMKEAIRRGEALQGWQVDRVAREIIASAGYGDAFTHRLGHSLGKEVHGNGVNLDGLETHDTRCIVEGLGMTIEPGIYLEDFGVRSEIDVFISKEGPVVTTLVQTEIVRIAGV